MIISLHKNATTTPGIRQRMAQSDEPAAVLAQRFGVSEKTALKWKPTTSLDDGLRACIKWEAEALV